jgi:hypothetical protein
VISAFRTTGAEGTPLDRFLDTKNSQKSVTVTDGSTSVVEMTLSP